MSDLQKLFVLVPSTSEATVASIKTASESTNKVYFMAKFNQIVAKGTVYGVDPSTGKELESLVTVLGGTKADDGTVSVDFSHLNYYTSEGTKTIIGAIEAIDAKVKGEMDKLAASKTLNDSYEFTGKLTYVAASGNVPAHIAIADESGAEITGTSINVSDIIGNGVLKTSAYDAATGILTLTFAQADGTEKAVEVNLKAMLDINDISIAEASKNYLEVTLGTADAEGETQAVFGAKVKKIVGAVESADLTGLADAADVKAYVDSKATDLAVSATGDSYVSASIDEHDNKHVIVAANVKDVTYTAGTHAEYNDEGVKTGNGAAATISGETKSLVDGAQATTAIKSYVDFVVAEEALRADAKVLSSIKALDKVSDTVNGTNVHVKYKEEDGIVTVEQVTEDYATVNYTAHSDSQNTSISVAQGDEDKLIKASDLANVAGYAAGKVAEEAARVDKKIADLRGSATINDVAGVTTTVTTSGGEVSTVSMTIADNAVIASGNVKARDLKATSTTGVLKGDAIASIKTYVDNVVADKNVEAEGDKGDIKFIAASAANNKVTVTGTYAVLTTGNTTYTNGIATGAFVHDLVGNALGDLWETYGA